MLCQKCKKNEATVHIVKIVNGEKQEICLCENCATEADNIQVNFLLVINIKKNFPNILNEFFQRIDNSNNSKKIDINKKMDIVCKNCGERLSNFQKTGKLGCPQCYNAFRDSLIATIEKNQAGNEHVGKVPKKNETELTDKKKIAILKEKLQECILLEAYEKAAVIRDEIKSLENNKEKETNYGKLD